MVRGLDIWKEFFADHTHNYVLIGGTACNIQKIRELYRLSGLNNNCLLNS